MSKMVKHLRDIANRVNELKVVVEDVITKAEEHAARGKYTMTYMHDRKFTTEATNSEVADFLKEHYGLQVNKSDDIDHTSNNFRTIKVHW